MKYYIIFSFSGGIGGGQNYADSKVRYMESQGWMPIVFTAYKIKRKIPWSYLRKYTVLQAPELAYGPEICSKKKASTFVKKMASFIRNADDVIIESSTDYWAEWGELLAKMLNAKNFCFLIDERLEQYNAKDFLWFKYQRGEVYGIHSTSIARLFNGYRNIEDQDKVLRASNYGSVQDIKSNKIDKIPHADYVIAYIGRNKQYCGAIWEGVITFVKENKDKRICFVVLGEMDIKTVGINNLKIINLGFMNPIPQNFFSKIDVAIAGAGCAFIAAREGVPVIVADAATCCSAGILGYTTFSALFSEHADIPFEKTLTDVLINKSHEKIEFKLPELSRPEVSYMRHFEAIQKSNDTKEYYDIFGNPQCHYSRKDKCQYCLAKHFQFVSKILKLLCKKGL